MSEPEVGYCERCAHDVVVEHRHSARLRRLLKGYLLLPLALVPLFPFLAGDYVFSLPMMMVYMLGIGPVLTIVRDPASCSSCGALVRPRRGRRQPAS